MPEETIYIKQAVGLRIDMITVNGWCAGGKVGGGGLGKVEDECSVNWGYGERLLSKHPPIVS